jgi:hypothetical protein
MKVVGIRVKDERAYKKIVKELEALNIPFINLNRVLCMDEASIVLTDEQGKGIYAGENINETIRACALAYAGRFEYIVIGIDPGPKPGIAVFGDDREICSCEASSPEKAVAFLKKILGIYEHKKSIIRIGSGARVYRDRIINGLLPLCVEIVEEKRTSRKHSDAAKEIAFMSGIVVHEPMEQRFEEGELKEIQKESRRLSGVTISRDLAKEVAEGKIDIRKAIKKQRDKNEVDSGE